MAQGDDITGWFYLLAIVFVCRAGCEAGEARAQRAVRDGVLRAPITQVVTGTFTTRALGERVVRALRSPADEDRAGLLAYLAGVHDTAAVLAAHELAAGCCEPAALALFAALARWDGDLHQVVAAAPATESAVAAAWREAARAPAVVTAGTLAAPDISRVKTASHETLPAGPRERIAFLVDGGFTQAEVRKKFPEVAGDAGVMACLPP